MNCMQRQIVQTVGNTIPPSYQSSFTGRTKLMYSPLQGRTLVYLESYTIRNTEPKGSVPNLEALKTQINSNFASEPVDATCESILVLQGALSDTYKFKTWVAETQSAEFMQANRALLARMFPALVLAVIICAAIITVTIGVVIIVLVLNASFMAVAQAFMPGKPSYIGGTRDAPKTYDDWAAYLSGQHLYYWYVCPLCGVGFGDKELYPNIGDVPPEEKAAFDEHRTFCLGIPQTSYNPLPLLIWVIIGVAAVVSVVYLLPKLFKSARPSRY